ncbi:hypothetical protein PG993_010172 [Apiospora rasikravindrae]|uniref:Uncharacterized protein n=1 Tax=Apiospora rasikravindrae TaxID=990691 RepID=A0ABR1SLI4_9PEZI
MRKLSADSNRSSNNTLRARVVTREIVQDQVMFATARDPNHEFLREFAKDPCSKTSTEGVMHTPRFSTMIETFSRCHNTFHDEDTFKFLQAVAYKYGVARSAPAPFKWDFKIGDLPEDLLWWGDVAPSMASIAFILDALFNPSYTIGWRRDNLMSWLHWVGEKVFLSSHWHSTKPLTSNGDSTTATSATRGVHRDFSSIGREPRGFEIRCARYNEPIIVRAVPENRNPEADRLFSVLRAASATGAPTFLGDGIDNKPWNYNPPPLQWSCPSYIYDKRGNLMGRGIMDDPEWFIGELNRIDAREQQEINEKVRRGEKYPKRLRNRRIVMLAFVERESLKLRAASMPPLPWDTTPVSWTSARGGRDRSVPNMVALEVNYGLILLTSGVFARGDGDSGDEEEDDEEKVIDTDLYERVGLFEVYGEAFASDRPKQIYLR